jgi:Protein of unknown function (DUF3618)
MAQGSDEVSRDSAIIQTNESTALSPAPSTGELRTQIEATRTEMGETIDAIQERLRPGRLLTDVKEGVKEAAVGRVKNLAQRASTYAGGFRDWSSATGNVLQRVKDNPVPVALLGAATAGLLMRALQRRTTGDVAAKHVARGRLARGNSNRGIRHAARLVAIAWTGAACWAIWKAQAGESTFSPPERNATPGNEL